MLYLTPTESKQWQDLVNETLENPVAPGDIESRVRPNLMTAFQCYIGTVLVEKGLTEVGVDWLRAGAIDEEKGLFFNRFLLGFLERHDNQLVMPETIFADPKPFIHFSTVPVMKNARELFLQYAGDSLPQLDHPIRIVDIGCGNGALIASLVQHLQAIGKVPAVEEILLVDASPGMIEIASETVAKTFPPSVIKTVTSRMQDFTSSIDARYDIAVSSLAYHHMPFEDKIGHMRELAPWIDHFILFELDADNDTPEQHTPELALSVYQSYGRVIDFVFAHDAPVEIAVACVDRFLMSEAISFFILPRGERTDYHMLRRQWHDLFTRGLGEEFCCACDSTCYADEHIDLFTIHYGRRA